MIILNNKRLIMIYEPDCITLKDKCSDQEICIHGNDTQKVINLIKHLL